jgi:hypothetical protein
MNLWTPNPDRLIKAGLKPTTKPIARSALFVRAPFFAAVVAALLLVLATSGRAQSQDLLMGNPAALSSGISTEIRISGI